MAKTDYAELAALAQELLQDSGREVTFVKYNKTPADTDKPWAGPADPRSTPEASKKLWAASVEPSSAVRLGIATADSDLVKRSQEILIVAPGTYAQDLSLFHEALDENVRWSITAVEKLRPAKVTVLYFVGVRR